MVPEHESDPPGPQKKRRGRPPTQMGLEKAAKKAERAASGLYSRKGGRPKHSAEEKELLLNATHAFVAELEEWTRPYGIGPSDLGKALLPRRLPSVAQKDGMYTRAWCALRSTTKIERSLSRKALLSAAIAAAKNYGWRDPNQIIAEICPGETAHNDDIAKNAAEHDARRAVHVVTQMSALVNELAQQFHWTEDEVTACVSKAAAALQTYTHEDVVNLRKAGVRARNEL